MIAPAIPDDEEARLQDLHELLILDTPPEERFEVLTRIAQAALGVPMASLSLIDRDRQWCKSSPGMDSPSVPRSISFCGHTILQDTPLLVSDATKDPRFHDNPLVSHRPKLRSYAGIPVFSDKGRCIGSFCALDYKPRSFTLAEVEILKDLAAMAQRELLNVELNRSLVEARQARAEAEAATQAKADFLAVMSHEIRTPLNGMLGMTTVLAGSSLTSEQQEWVETLRNSGDALLALINDILDFSKIESGKLELEAIPVDCRRLVKEALSLFRYAAGEKGIALSGTVAPAVPEIVTGDPLRLRQVLLNLLGNALKFTERGAVAIEVEAEAAKGEGTLSLLFRVRDTGLGIPPEACARLFQRFSQADVSTSRNYGGTGLGLAICRSLVDLMGGVIGVQGEVGKGSTFQFSVSLPVPDAKAERRADGTVLPHGAVGAPLRVLVVDDNGVNQKVASLFVRKLGHHADFVGSGVACLERLRTESYDVVLMDIQMPEMDGLEATRRIRAERPGNDPWIVALSAHTFTDDVDRCQAGGMNDFLTKPLNLDLLRTALARFAATRAAA